MRKLLMYTPSNQLVTPPVTPAPAAVTWADGTALTAGNTEAITFSAEADPVTGMTFGDGTQITFGDGTEIEWTSGGVSWSNGDEVTWADGTLIE